MPSFRVGTVAAVHDERPGLQHVELTDGAPAFVLTRLTGPVAAGDEVLCNVTAVELGLGTGGRHVVHANLSRSAWSAPPEGHVMKLRYTSLQTEVRTGEETAGELPADLGGVPVVACTLHSQVAVVAAAVASRRPGTRVVYVMTDGAALPLALSDLVATLQARGLVASTVTAGNAFGGDLEAVGVPSALALARHRAGADLVVVGMGPGVVGTGTPLGTTALEAAPVLDAAAALGGVPVLCVRASAADPRERHQGLSHHAATVLDLVRSAVDVPVPPSLVPALGPWAARHRVVPTETGDVAALLDAAGVAVTSMGRGPAEDPLFFAAAAAAGLHASGTVR